MLVKPLLYTSDYFEKDKSLYYDKLTFACDNNDLIGWIKFFLQAVESTAVDAVKSLKEIITLKDKLTDSKVSTLGRKQKNAQKSLGSIFMRPVVTASLVAKNVELSPKASNDLLRDFVSLGILKEITGYKRNRLFVFSDYLKILNKKTPYY